MEERETMSSRLDSELINPLIYKYIDPFIHFRKKTSCNHLNPNMQKSHTNTFSDAIIHRIFEKQI